MNSPSVESKTRILTRIPTLFIAPIYEVPTWHTVFLIKNSPKAEQIPSPFSPPTSSSVYHPTNPYLPFHTKILSILYPFPFRLSPSTMASSKLSLFFVFLSILSIRAVVDGATHHHAAPAPSVDCSTLILNMADCLSFVSNDSTTTKPEGSCCSGLKTVLQSDAECLCEAFKSSAQLGVVLNVTKALSLPAACKLHAPSVSNCGCQSSLAFSLFFFFFSCGFYWMYICLSMLFGNRGIFF